MLYEILECNETRIRFRVSRDSSIWRVELFTNGVSRVFWTNPQGTEKTYDFLEGHIVEGLNEIKLRCLNSSQSEIAGSVTIKHIIRGLNENSSLQSIINENISIKDDISTCCDNFKNNLIDKGVEVLETDKMSDLVDKIDLLDKKKPIPDDLINSRDLISFSMEGLSPGFIRIPDSWIFLDPSTYVDVRSYNFQTMVSENYDVGGLRNALSLDFEQIVNYRNDIYLISGGYTRVCHWDTKTFEDLTAIHGRRDYNGTILVQHPQNPNLLYIYEQSQNNSTRYFKIYDMDVRAIIHSSSNISPIIGSSYIMAMSPIGNDFVYLVSNSDVFIYDLNTSTINKITTSKLTSIAKPGSIASPPSSFSSISFGGYLTNNSMWLLFNLKYLFTLNLTNMELIGRSRTMYIRGYIASDSILISGSQSVNTGIHFLDYDKLKNYLK